LKTCFRYLFINEIRLCKISHRTKIYTRGEKENYRKRKEEKKVIGNNGMKIGVITQSQM
jgi:hypothetical protein